MSKRNIKEDIEERHRRRYDGLYNYLKTPENKTKTHRKKERSFGWTRMELLKYSKRRRLKKTWKKL